MLGVALGLVLAAAIGSLPIALGGCQTPGSVIGSAELEFNGRIGQAVGGGTAVLPMGPISGIVVGAVIVPNGTTVTAVDVLLRGLAVPITDGLDATHIARLEGELLGRGVFDPATEQLMFRRTLTSVTVFDGDDVQVIVHVVDASGQPATSARLGFGAALATTLDDPGPFSTVDLPASDDVFGYQPGADPEHAPADADAWELLNAELVPEHLDCCWALPGRPNPHGYTELDATNVMVLGLNWALPRPPESCQLIHAHGFLNAPPGPHPDPAPGPPPLPDCGHGALRFRPGIISLTPSGSAAVISGYATTYAVLLDGGVRPFEEVRLYVDSSQVAVDDTPADGFALVYHPPFTSAVVTAPLFVTGRDALGTGASSTTQIISIVPSDATPLVTITGVEPNPVPYGASFDATAEASSGVEPYVFRFRLNGGLVEPVDVTRIAFNIERATILPVATTHVVLYDLTAEVEDATGRSNESEPVPVTVSGSGATPVVTILDLQPGTTVPPNGNLDVTAEASNGVEPYAFRFRLDSVIEPFDVTMLSTSQSLATFHPPVTTSTVIRLLTVDVEDAEARTGSAPPQVITFAGTDATPIVVISQPPAGAVVLGGSFTTVIADVASDLPIVRVDFTADDELFGTDTTGAGSQFSALWGVPVATTSTVFVLRAIARDSAGLEGVSEGVSVTVPGTDTHPTVSITQPTSGTAFLSGRDATLLATAGNGYGGIVRVEFLGNGVPLGDATEIAEGWQRVWQVTPIPPDASAVMLVARAFDSAGQSADSAPVEVFVLLAPIPTLSAWGLAALVALLAATRLVALRRERQRRISEA